MNKRQLYESIMSKVAKQIKKSLNESYASEFSENNPYNAALMNLDDVRKSLDHASADVQKKYDDLFAQLETEAEEWEEQEKARQRKAEEERKKAE